MRILRSSNNNFPKAILFGYNLVVEHILCPILEGVAGYVKGIRLARCRQANESWTGNKGNNL